MAGRYQPDFQFEIVNLLLECDLAVIQALNLLKLKVSNSPHRFYLTDLPFVVLITYFSSKIINN